MNKQTTAESVEILQSDSTKTSVNNWKVQKPTERKTEDSLIVKLTKQPVPFVIPQIDGPLEINGTENTSQTSHNKTSDESTQTDDTNKPEPLQVLEGLITTPWIMTIQIQMTYQKSEHS